MNASLHASRPHALSALSLLFARYVAGQITEAAWSRIMQILDTGEASVDERIALASFLSDACLDLGPAAVEVPVPEEVEEMLTYTRAA